jgi:hypothetical protein
MSDRHIFVANFDDKFYLREYKQSNDGRFYVSSQDVCIMIARRLEILV